MTANQCPYLKFVEESATPSTASTGRYGCFATEPPFTPVEAHVNSCCTNHANFQRCPFYKKPTRPPPTLAKQKPAGLLQRLRRLFA